MNFFHGTNIQESETAFGILTGDAVSVRVYKYSLNMEASKGECSLVHEFKGLWKPQKRLE